MPEDVTAEDEPQGRARALSQGLRERWDFLRTHRGPREPSQVRKDMNLRLNEESKLPDGESVQIPAIWVIEPPRVS